MLFVWILLSSTLAPNMEAIKVFVTNYNFSDFTSNELHYTGLTFKREQVEARATFAEITFCFRLNVEFFRFLSAYSFLLEMLDGGGWRDGAEVVGDSLRLLEFRLRHNNHLHSIPSSHHHHHFLPLLPSQRPGGERSPVPAEDIRGEDCGGERCGQQELALAQAQEPCPHPGG